MAWNVNFSCKSAICLNIFVRGCRIYEIWTKFCKIRKRYKLKYLPPMKYYSRFWKLRSKTKNKHASVLILTTNCRHTNPSIFWNNSLFQIQYRLLIHHNCDYPSWHHRVKQNDRFVCIQVDHLSHHDNHFGSSAKKYLLNYSDTLRQTTSNTTIHWHTHRICSQPSTNHRFGHGYAIIGVIKCIANSVVNNI